MISGRNPWHEATDKDEVYAGYCGADPQILQRNLKLDADFDTLLKKRIFHPDPTKRSTATEAQLLISCIRELSEADPQSSAHTKLECYDDGSMVKFRHSQSSVSDSNHSMLLNPANSTTSFFGSAVALSKEAKENNSYTGSMDELGRFVVQALGDRMGTSEPRIRLKKNLDHLINQSNGSLQSLSSLNGSLSVLKVDREAK